MQAGSQKQVVEVAAPVGENGRLDNDREVSA
jgi:hypothetical protein